MTVRITKYTPILAGLSSISFVAMIIDKPVVILAVLAATVVGFPVFITPWLGYFFTVGALPIEVVGNLGNIVPFINITVAKLFAVLTLGVYLIHVLVGRMRFIWCRELSLWCFYVGIGLFSLVGGDEVSRGLKEIVVTVSTIVFLFLTVNFCTDTKKIDSIIYLVAIVSVATFAFAVIQRYLPSFSIHERIGWDLDNDVSFGFEVSKLDAGAHGEVHRSAGVSGHPNVMAATTGLILPLVIWIYHITNDTRIRIAAILGVLACLAGAVTSLSRSGMMVYMIVLPALYFFRLIRPTVNQFAAAILLVILSIPVWPKGFIHRVLSPESWTSSGSETVKWRYKLWDAALQAIADNPINGVGIGNNRTIFEYFYYPWNEGLQTVHNSYLQITMETGLPGLLCWLALFGLIIKRCLDLMRNSAVERKYRILAQCILASLLGFMFVGMGLDFNRIGFKTLWLQLGIVIALHRVVLDPHRLSMLSANAQTQPTRRG